MLSCTIFWPYFVWFDFFLSPVPALATFVSLVHNQTMISKYQQLTITCAEKIHEKPSCEYSSLACDIHLLENCLLNCNTLLFVDGFNNNSGDTIKRVPWKAWDKRNRNCSISCLLKKFGKNWKHKSYDTVLLFRWVSMVLEEPRLYCEWTE